MCILGNSRTEESLSGRAAQWALTFSSSKEEKPTITPGCSAHLNRWDWRAIG